MELTSRLSRPLRPVSDAATADRRLVPPIGIVEVDVPAGSRHLALPSDLFALTVYCQEDLSCMEEGEDFRPEVTVTTLRTRPGRFVTGGRGELALVMLTPAELLSIVRAPLEGQFDRRLPLEHLCGAAEQRRLRDSLRLAASRAERIERLGRWLEERLTDRAPLCGAQRRVAQATRHMLQAPHLPALDSVAGLLGVSRRQVERDFVQWLGVSPMHFIRLVRFQRAARSIANGSALVDAAVDAGYADQPHFNRSVRGLTGMTPRGLRTAARGTSQDMVLATLADRLLIGATSEVALDSPRSATMASDHVRLLARASRH